MKLEGDEYDKRLEALKLIAMDVRAPVREYGLGEMSWHEFMTVANAVGENDRRFYQRAFEDMGAVFDVEVECLKNKIKYYEAFISRVSMQSKHNWERIAAVANEILQEKKK